ncbi:hypothetical protein [Methanobacterium sp.]|uniref:hypothetical protein n=1 Tax=Methanobacterium sp. TaxID=2164 RepID=UPI003C75C42F
MVYEIVIPSIPFVMGYLVTYTLYKTGLIRKSLHVNLWNFILFSAFLVTAVAGFILMILLDLGLITSINLGLLYWHVEFGITMALVTLFHIGIYWKSARRLFTGGRVKS